MRTSIDIDEEMDSCTVVLDKEMDEKETNEVFSYLKEKKVHMMDRFILVFPEAFLFYEYFRMETNKFFRDGSNGNPDFNVAIVTTLMNVRGYEEFAKFINGLVGRQRIFEKLEDAETWLKNK
ncbi:MAG: hypothetical protein ACTSUE_27200 [Promethearchaeota archaeon]